MKEKRDVYEIVNSRIIEALEKGVIPWRMPWAVKGRAGIPVNHATGRRYSGFNVFNLTMIVLLEGYTTNRWITRKQAAEKGGRVKEGELYHPVTFWKFIEKWEEKDEIKKYMRENPDENR